MSDKPIYYHSVRLDKNKCQGCTNCLKRCPTDAIRIRDNRAMVIKQNCIDCGECIRVCKHHAKVAVTDKLSVMQNFEYKIALPAPALYSQFPQIHNSEPIIASLYRLGFDEVFEVARAAEVVSYAISKAMITEDRPRPVISSACPAVLRLIQIKYPSLIEHVIDIVSPMEAAAKLAKEDFAAKHNVPIEKIGAFFISPCAAKLTAIRNPIGQEKSYVDGVLSIRDLYTQIKAHVKDEFDPLEIERASTVGVRWSIPTGEAEAVGMRHTLSVDGIENVKRTLELIENNQFERLDYVECLACTNGCLGGPLTVENGFVSKSRLNAILKHTPDRKVQKTKIFENALENFRMSEPIQPSAALQLTGSMAERLQKAAAIEKLNDELPGLDCGSCGSPSCRSLAWDVVNGFAHEYNCIFKLNSRINSLAQEMIALGVSTRFSVGMDRENANEFVDHIFVHEED